VIKKFQERLTTEEVETARTGKENAVFLTLDQVIDLPFNNGGALSNPDRSFDLVNTSTTLLLSKRGAQPE